MAHDGTPKSAADTFIPDHRSEFEPTQRWIRVRLGNEFVADSKRAMLFRETGRLPIYYFPQEDVRMDLLSLAGEKASDSAKGPMKQWNVRAGDKTAESAAWQYPAPGEGAPDLSKYVAFEWKKMDAWFEEDDEVFVHPRDPYKRIDVVHSSRHIQVVVLGETVADTRRPRLLFETGLPTRYYIPKADVRMELLVPSDSHTRCPYKGQASYYSVKVGDQVAKDIVWYYPMPIPECPKIENLVCFYNEKVDAIYIDGEKEEKRPTPWS